MKKACELFVVAIAVGLAVWTLDNAAGRALLLVALYLFGIRCGWAIVAAVASAIPATQWELRRYQAEESEQTQRSLEHKRSKRFTVN